MAKAKGRPKKAARDLRVNVLRIRLTLAERAKLEAAIKGRGFDVSTWARSVLLKAAESAR